MLTAAEELHLGTMVQAWQTHADGPEQAPAGVIRRGRRARDRIVTANLRLVASLAKRMRAQSHRNLTDDDMPDLLQGGSMGLVRAAELFDPTRGYKFSTFAYWWIRQGMVRHMIEQSRPIYIPDKMGQKLCKTGRAIERLTASLGRHPTTAEVAADLDIDSFQLHELIRVAAVPVSLDGPAAIGGDASDGKLLDLITSPAGNPDTEEQLELERRLKILPPVVASIIRDYHGVGTLRVPMKKLAEKHKITIPRIKKIIDDAEVRLRNCLSQDALCSD
jgi:RNA polymerase nonessential primary-like sigma factor